MFRAAAEGRIRRACLEPQPDDAVPRFAYEEHMAALTGPDRAWPHRPGASPSCASRSNYERPPGWRSGPATLALDIVDYPGEWLLDLALIERAIATWSRDAVAASRPRARPHRAAWRASSRTLEPGAAADEEQARGEPARLFTGYLAALPRRARRAVHRCRPAAS